MNDDMINSELCMFWTWIGFLITWQVVSIVLFFVYLPYNGWDVNANHNETSMMRNIFFIVQAVPGLLAIAFGFFVLLFLFGKCLRWSCGCLTEQFHDEITNAKAKVDGFKPVEDVGLKGDIQHILDNNDVNDI